MKTSRLAHCTAAPTGVGDLTTHTVAQASVTFRKLSGRAELWVLLSQADPEPAFVGDVFSLV